MPRVEVQRKPPPTFLCRNRDEVTRALVCIRKHLGISQMDLDDMAGFHQGYTGKLEQPDSPARHGKQKTGRSAINPMFDIWISALNVGLLLVPLAPMPEIPDELIVRLTAPPMTLKRAEKMRALHRAGRSRNTLYKLFQCSPKLVDDILAGRKYAPSPVRAAA